MIQKNLLPLRTAGPPASQALTLLMRTIVRKPGSQQDQGLSADQVTRCCSDQVTGPKPEQLFANPIASSLEPDRPDPIRQALHGDNPNILARFLEPARKKAPSSCPRPRLTRTKHRQQARISPSARQNGVICPIMGLFAIFYYLDHIFCSGRDILHPTLCHALKFRKLLKHLLPTHLRYVLVHNVTLVHQ